MNTKNFAGLFLCLSAIAVSVANASAPARWSYSGKTGPDRWASLSPDYALCSSGKNQSPVDITKAVSAGLEAAKIAYEQPGKSVSNKGHTISFPFDGTNKVTLEKCHYRLRHLIFHAPSEHRLNGEKFPMEAQFFHDDADHNVLIIAVLIKKGTTHTELDKVWNLLPERESVERKLYPGFVPGSLLPQSRDYFRYNGSLTAPPCSEGITWLVFRQPVELSQLQIDRFTEIAANAGGRPIQKVNARLILQQ